VAARSPTLIATLASGVLAVAPLTWWFGGRLNQDVGSDPDYLWQPPALSAHAELGIGLVSLGVAATALSALLWAVRTGRLHPEVLRVLAPIAAISAYAGALYSVATAPVIGANIGGGMMLIAGPPFVLAMLRISATTARRQARTRRLS